MEENIKNTALLIMDVQPGIVNRIEENKDEYLSKVSKVVEVAHKNKIPVIYVVVGFRSGFHEVNSRNKSFGSIPESSLAAMVDPFPVHELTDIDALVTKKRVSAFTGSDLEVVLRSKSIHHLVLTGISTSGVVLSTLREAADKDYKITVLSDVCYDFDKEVHTVLTEKVFPRQADVMTSDSWIKTFKK